MKITSALTLAADGTLAFDGGLPPTWSYVDASGQTLEVPWDKGNAETWPRFSSDAPGVTVEGLVTLPGGHMGHFRMFLNGTPKKATKAKASAAPTTPPPGARIAAAGSHGGTPVTTAAPGVTGAQVATAQVAAAAKLAALLAAKVKPVKLTKAESKVLAAQDPDVQTAILAMDAAAQRETLVALS